MTEILLDTNYWICFKDERRELFEEFEELVQEKDIEVLFSFGNFIDLVKRDEQDELAEMIPSVVSEYITPQEYKDDHYSYSTNPLDLIPDEEIKEEARLRTRGLDDADTLKHMFEVSGWEGVEEYKESIQYLKSVQKEHGKKYVLALLFDVKPENPVIYPQEEGRSEMVANTVITNRIAVLDPHENITYSDVADIEICIHALITNCDILLIESKWKNVELLESTMDDLSSSTEIEVLDQIDEFMDRLREIENDSGQ